MRKKVIRKKPSKKQFKCATPLDIDRALIPKGWEWAWVDLEEFEHKSRLYGYEPIPVGLNKKLDKQYKHLIGKIPGIKGKYFILESKFYSSKPQLYFSNPKAYYRKPMLILCEVPESIAKCIKEKKELETFSIIKELAWDAILTEGAPWFMPHIELEDYSIERNMSGVCFGKNDCILYIDTMYEQAIIPSIGDNGSYDYLVENHYFLPESLYNVIGYDGSYNEFRHFMEHRYDYLNITREQRLSMDWKDPLLKDEENFENDLLNQINYTNYGSICC